MNSNIVLCTLENVKESINKKWNVHGTLTLSRIGEIFYIHWIKLNGTKEQCITAVFDHEYCTKNKKSDKWIQGDNFSLSTHKIKSISFHETPEIRFIIKLDGKDQTREFAIDENEHISFIFFLQQLIGNGICVPSLDSFINEESRYNLEFCPLSYRNTFLTHPTHIRMDVNDFEDLEELWNRMLKYLSKLIVFLDGCGEKTIDPHYLMNVASRTIHSRFIEKIEAYMDKEIKGKYKDITLDNFDELFDSEGRVKDEKEFKERLFHANTDPKLLTELIPFIVGLYKCDSTKKERNELNKKLEDEFNKLKGQLDLMQEEQLDGNEKVKSYFKVVGNDVRRTDRNLTAFKSDNSIGLKSLTLILRIFTIFNPPISYLQGMNDLLVPFITTFFPCWTEEGVPIDEETKEPIDYEKKLPLIFWCFEAMLNNTEHTNILKNVTCKSPEIANEVIMILNKLAPHCSVWMRKNKLEKLLWCYSDFVLIFKRSFEDIWPVWIQFNVAPEPGKFLVLFLTATIISAFDKFAKLREISITIMMDNYHKIIDTLNPKEIGEIALYVYKNYYSGQKNDEQKTVIENDCNVSFEFFKPT